jgi:hypothetical protein
MFPATIADYEILIYSLLDDYPSIHSSTLRVIRTSPTSGQVIGHLAFANDIRLEAAEVVDFDSGSLEILQYGYTIYQGEKRLYWYDSQPHPNDPTLASSHPHHKHVPPDIKHHRIPAPGLSFTRPNLLSLIEEIEQEML